jgi:hypothetical protein
VPIATGIVGTPQYVTQPSELFGIDCPTTNVCEAVGQPGSVAITIVNGTAGPTQQIPLAYNLNGVSCPTTASCQAVGSDFNENNGVIATIPIAPPATTTTVVSSHNPTIPGNPVTYTATVAPAPDGGTASFSDGGAPITGCTAQRVNTTSGQAACTVSYTTTGTHSVTASYSGDSNFAPSGPSTPVLERVVPPPTATVKPTNLVITELNQQITGTASDTGGPGVAAVILYYKNLSTGAVGVLGTQCAGCGTGVVSTTWSYTPRLNAPLARGRYIMFAQAIDTATNFGPPSNVVTVLII